MSPSSVRDLGGAALPARAGDDIGDLGRRPSSPEGLGSRPSLRACVKDGVVPFVAVVSGVAERPLPDVPAASHKRRRKPFIGAGVRDIILLVIVAAESLILQISCSPSSAAPRSS